MDYSDYITYSQDYNIDFTIRDYRRGINHLICAGKGQNEERIVVHLYVQKDGSIGKSNMPIIVPFTVPAFQASTPSHKIKVDLGVTMQNANYKLSIENQSVKVQYSSYKWLDYTIDTKTVSSVTIGFYNEQSKAIAKTDWALIIFPS